MLLRVVFPGATSHQSSGGHALVQRAVGGEKVVLIVEDEPDNREIMRAVVEELLGLRAVLASDGRNAVQLAASVQPAVILMDLMISF